ncbi:MAG: dihydroorotate dehydrogenase electron transfer subunit [Planctomycetota bacterium]
MNHGAGDFGAATRTPSTIVANVALGEGWHRLDIENPPLAAACRPGQFVQVRIGDGDDPLIRRPFSVYRVDPAGAPEHLSLLYQVVGPGTRWMARRPAGAAIDLLGPLGNPFPAQHGDRQFLVGGGIGVAPLFFYALEQRRRGEQPGTLLLGARRASLLVSADDLAQVDLPVEYATDDGSAGHHGNVVELLEKRRSHAPEATVVGIGCGPHGMNMALRDYALQHALEFWISLDNYMPCGFGACFGCVIPSPDGSGYRRVCVEGPAFPASEIPATIAGMH